MSNYWQKRFQAIEEMNNKRAKDTVQAITPAFDQAQVQIEKEINAWYARFAKNNQISLQEAKKLLNTKELKEFHWDVEEYIKYGRENALDQKWMKELENASARFHVSRLEALKIRTQNAAERAFGNELDQIDQMAARVYMDDYYHTAYEIQRGLGIGFDVAQIDQRKLDNLLSKPWTADNKTFKDRIWTSKSSMISELHNQMTRMCILGKSPDEAIREMEKFVDKKCKNAKMAAGRLVMTESAYFASAAQKDCFNDLDVEKFEVVATLDSHTSEICQNMDGQVFDMKDFQAGVTAPPFHVWCRSCTCPWFEDNDDGMRAARDPDTGETYYVPADMKYGDWKNSFVNGGSKDGLTPVVDIDDLRKQLADKQNEFDDLKKQIADVQFEKGEFESGRDNPFYKSFHSMSDDEYQKYVDDLKKQNDSLTAEYKGVLADYDRYYARPARKTPEREEWDKWYEGIKTKYGIDDGGELFNIQNDIYNKRSAVRDKMNDTLGFSNWKSKYGTKTEQYYLDELDKLTNTQKTVQGEIDDLQTQIEEALKLQGEAAYNARSLEEIKDEIVKKHESILKTDAHKEELSEILDGMTKERANLYEKMSAEFGSNNYYEKGTGWYTPSEHRIHMDMNSHSWDDRLGRASSGAWKTKFHEEFHQVDHILASRKSSFALLANGSGKHAYWAFTETRTVTGQRLIKAIDEDVLNLINRAIDWNVATNGVSVKHIRSLSRISSDAKDSLLLYLSDHYSTPKARATIDTVTDMIGLTTGGNVHPYSYGFWGHTKSYCKQSGKDGATSEVWANMSAFYLRGDTEVLDALSQIIPNTVTTYGEVFNEVADYAKTNPLTYAP